VARRNGPNEPSTGTFNLVLQGSANPAATAEPVSLIYGQPVAGRLTADIFEKRYTLIAHAGDGLIVTLNAVSGSTLDPMILLLDPGGTLLSSNDDRATGIKDSTLAYEVPRDGRYTIIATRSGEASGTTSGDYILKVDRRQAGSSLESTPGSPGSPGPAITPIRYGSTVDGTINAGHFAYYYGFEGTQGDVISISIKTISGDLEPVLYLYAYSGSPTLIASSAEAGITQFGLPTSGPYLIVATRTGAAQGQSEGNFILMLTRQK
jgi:hypothetical protein